MRFHQRTAEAAKGKWRGILIELGIPADVLRDRHGPCPLCGGKDRFRFDNREGTGSYICGQCGAGTGMKLAMEFLGLDFQPAALRIDEILGNKQFAPDKPKPVLADEDRLRILRETWASSRPIEPGDLADRYLTARGIGQPSYPSALRFAPALRDGEGGIRPCLVAAVGVYGEPKLATIHRTFLRPDGLAKAEIERPRQFCPGSIPEGVCVALSEYHGGPLGIAEGIETAMSASDLFQMPVWAALNARLMTRWTPPEGCTEVAIFADHDSLYGGQEAAYSLAHKLAVRAHIAVTVHLPDAVGQDWNDVLMLRQRVPA